MKLVIEILPFDLQHNAEAEAVDLLLEVDDLERIKAFVSPDNVDRVGAYLLGFSSYLTDIEEFEKVVRVAYDVYISNGKYPEALRVAMKLDSIEAMSSVFHAASDPTVKKQLGLMLSTQRTVLPEFIDDEDMMSVMGNSLV
jgi:26S proteasome regulatory subunit N1